MRLLLESLLVAIAITLLLAVVVLMWPFARLGKASSVAMCGFIDWWLTKYRNQLSSPRNAPKSDTTCEP